MYLFCAHFDNEIDVLVFAWLVWKPTQLMEIQLSVKEP